MYGAPGKLYFDDQNNRVSWEGLGECFVEIFPANLFIVGHFLCHLGSYLYVCCVTESQEHYLVTVALLLHYHLFPVTFISVLKCSILWESCLDIQWSFFMLQPRNLKSNNFNVLSTSRERHSHIYSWPWQAWGKILLIEDPYRKERVEPLRLLGSNKHCHFWFLKNFFFITRECKIQLPS